MERNTQFAGFAKALFKELLGSAGYIDMNEYDTDEVDRYEYIIAQRAYDLVKHALDYAYTHTTEDAISAIPDLTELPEVSE